MHAGRSLCLYGPSGSGKSTLARKLGRLLQGLVAVPYAVAVGSVVIQLYDAAVHLAPPPMPGRGSGARGGDARWLLCQRPVVQLGAELEAGMLDLRHDAAGGCYLAPPQLKACHGLLIFDDVGRQRLPASALLGRLAQLLDSGTDQLALPGGHAFSVPCSAALAFATNLDPQALLDGAALRRIGYKVALGPLPEASYRSLLRQQCRARGIDADEAALAYLVGELHRGSGQPLLPSLPREIVARVAEFAGFAGTVPILNPATLDQAWSSMFAAGVA
jgi:energy-coupling factor transporter ATP-binding protein EcfA2